MKKGRQITTEGPVVIITAAAFLLSDDAGYIAGRNLRVDGGITRSV